MPNNPHIEIITRIRKLSRSLDKYSKYLDNKYHVTLPQLLCLNEMHAHGSTSLSNLTRKLNMNNSALTGIVDRLETKGLLQRIRQSHDRRTVYIDFTDTGRQYAEQLLQVLETDSFFDANKITTDKLAFIVASLDQIISSFDPEVKKIELAS
ncbi:MarR family transcriptional regulator [Desulfobulbus rhabdoformis]|jgi:DNA-binding MarR family transcriptional regulator|uniref:MarR family winged helix-turn-helix transcriptional regulator n=1 Tax=Desulfobulbus rhabdoformis TaxID=34032 RepID=UPI0019659C0C|nr:MarR family transcriptional regulator [Desulfobulbus rhabdoformis]MBM9615514.1 MarR family transcriptional regulator [Desulfobulbus rhabdoformis]